MLYRVPDWTETDSFKCLFVSRMHNTRAHAEVSLTLDAVAKAPRGVLATLGLIAPSLSFTVTDPRRLCGGRCRTRRAGRRQRLWRMMNPSPGPGLATRISISLFR